VERESLPSVLLGEVLVGQERMMNKLSPDGDGYGAVMDPELRHRIGQRAYSLWESDGRPEGRAMDYWLAAEQEIADQSIAGEEDPFAGIDQAVGRRSPATTHETNTEKRAGPGPGQRTRRGVRDETGPP
jgi:hypothetical protein